MFLILSLIHFHFSASLSLEHQNELFSCPDEEWNRKRTDSIPNGELHNEWMRQNWTRRDNMYGAEMRLLNAFLYEDFIAITTTVEYKTGKPAYCRYFDCMHREIPNSTWQSVFFPLTTVYCARRAGAKFVSISFERELEPEQKSPEPIPLTFRAFPEPVHEVSMCVGPFYGADRKWLQLIEFVEHHRNLDVSMFYFTVFNMDSYSRTALDEYERLGLAELTHVQTEYEQLDWQFHLIQVHDCFHRSKYHSKWVINADIDERFTVLQPDLTLVQLLRSQSEDVGEVNFQARRIQKTSFSPSRFTALRDVIENLELLKFHKTAAHTWASSKSVYRPEKVAGLTYHFSFLQYPGVIVKYFSNKVGEFRHYRITKMDKSIGNGWTKRDLVVEETSLEQRLEQELVHRITDMVDFVYGNEP